MDGVVVQGKRAESIIRAIQSIERLIEANVRTLRRISLGLRLEDLLILSGLRSLEHLTVKFDCAHQLNQLIIRNKNRGK